MITKHLKRRLLRARIKLKQTIYQILEINKLRKQLAFFKDRREKEQALQEELRVLNKIAEQQAILVRRYEETLGTEPRR